MQKKRIFTALLGGLAGAGAAMVYTKYRKDISSIQRTLDAGSNLVYTPLGNIEYAVRGHGFPVLLSHGAGGGYDQGLLIGNAWFGDDFRCIAPSRFGYLRTPLPPKPSAELQADAFVCLLDRLGVDRVAVAGISAGGPSAIQMALRHPDRVFALILISAAAGKPSSPESDSKFPLPAWVYPALFRSDFIFWSLATYANHALLSAFGAEKSIEAFLPSAEKEMLKALVRTMLPVRGRAKGLAADAAIIDEINRYPLENINTPTLVIHALDDLIAPFTWGEFAAESIPGSEFMAFRRGGHLLLGHQAEIRNEISSFIRRHSGQNKE